MCCGDIGLLRLAEFYKEIQWLTICGDGCEAGCRHGWHSQWLTTCDHIFTFSCQSLMLLSFVLLILL